MSRLAEYRALEQQLAQQLAELESLKNDDGLQKEIEFETKLRALLGEYGYSLRNIISLLDPQASHRAPARAEKIEKSTRRPRSIKVYKNPATGEVIETKGGNHRKLKEWKTEYGSDTVNSWLAQ